MEEKKNKRVPLYNPLPDKFSYEWKDDDNTSHTLEMEPGVTFFNEPQAKFMTKHLADEIIGRRGVKTNHEAEYEKIIKEIKDISL